MKLLVIEDDRTVGQYVKRGLAEAGFQVDLVVDGAEGLRVATEGHYDVVVLDLRLPTLDGREVLRTMRDRGNTVPVLVLTAQDTVDFKVQALRMGADDYVTKPFALEELLARVEALGRRPKAITPGSAEKARIIASGAMWLKNVNRIMSPETSMEAALNVWRTRSPWPAPKFCPARGAVAKAIAITGRNIDCITRAPMPKPACAEAPKARMIQ